MNIYDIAKKTNYSPSTVSRVLNNSDRVSDTARETILKFCEENNYSINVVAQSLSKQESKNIAFIIPDIKNNFFAGIYRGLRNVVEKRDLNVILYDTNDNASMEKKYLSTLKQQLIAGVVIVPVEEDNSGTLKILNSLNNSNIPVVMVDRNLNGSKFPSVFVDNKIGAFNAVCELARRGSKNIATITGPLNSSSGKNRYDGYLEALKKNNLEINKNWVLEGDFRVEKSIELFKKLFLGERKPDALFSANNMTTIGCVAGAKDLNLMPGVDFLLAGFDYVEILSLIGLDLIMVDSPVEKMGEKAGKLLLNRLQNNNIPCKKLILKTKVITK